MTKTNISELGEFGLIDRLTNDINLFHKETIRGIGDDAAVIRHLDQNTLLTTDLLIEGVHFNIMYTPLKHLGYKAVAVNLSDIYAMNGNPTHVVVGIGISSKYTVESLEELYLGMKLACEKFKIDFVGGDTTSSQSGLLISVTAYGTANTEDITYRSGMQVNDLVCVSGDLGGAYAGLLILEREKEAFKANPSLQPDLAEYTYVIERQLKPEPRRDIIDMLRENKIIPTSMIDVSDGLGSELKHLCKLSAKGVVIYEQKLPIDIQTANVAHEFKIDPTTFAFNGGEDYELLFTIKQSDYPKLKDSSLISIIGHVTDNPAQNDLITTSGNVVPITAQGWNPDQAQ